MLFTDYSKVKGIVLSYPENHKEVDNHNLAPFFIQLIKLIPIEIEIALICKSEELFEKAESLCPDANLKKIIIPEMEEIWLRDILGFYNKPEVILPQFRPTYFQDHYTEDVLFQIKMTAFEIHHKTIPDFHPTSSSIYLDGGNLITNGEIAFVTEKIKEDNKQIANLEERFEEELGVKPFFLEHFPKDRLGHADGYVCFLDKYTVGLSYYPEHLKSLKKEREYLIELKEELEYQRFKVVSIHDRPVDEKYKNENDWIYSARGSYINFLRLNKVIILPQFALPNQKVNLDFNTDNKEILENEGFEILTIDADDLYRLGGGLRCISWVY